MEAPHEAQVVEPKVEPINPFLTYEAMRTYTDAARFIALVDVAAAARSLEIKPTSQAFSYSTCNHPCRPK